MVSIGCGRVGGCACTGEGGGVDAKGVEAPSGDPYIVVIGPGVGGFAILVRLFDFRYETTVQGASCAGDSVEGGSRVDFLTFFVFEGVGWSSGCADGVRFLETGDGVLGRRLSRVSGEEEGFLERVMRGLSAGVVSFDI